MNEENIDLQKRLCMLLSSMGQQLPGLLQFNKEAPISLETWKLYIQIMDFFISHDNLIFSSLSVQFWNIYFRNFSDFRSNHLLDIFCLEKILQILPSKLVRQTYDSNKYFFELSSNEDYESFYFKYRADILDLLRQLTVIDEKICFNFSVDALSKLLNSSDSANQVQWEVLSQVLAAVCGKLKDPSLVSLDLLIGI